MQSPAVGCSSSYIKKESDGEDTALTNHPTRAGSIEIARRDSSVKTFFLTKEFFFFSQNLLFFLCEFVLDRNKIFI